MSKIDFAKIEKGVNGYLDAALKDGKIDRQSYEMAKKNTMMYIEQWLTDKNFIKLSPNLHKGILAAVRAKKWEDIVNTFRKKMSFGTGGIRGFMAGDRDSIMKLKKRGLDAPILIRFDGILGQVDENTAKIKSRNRGVAWPLWQGDF